MIGRSVRGGRGHLIACVMWLVLLACACGVERTEAEIDIDNRTDEALFITYGESLSDAEEADRHPRELEIAAETIHLTSIMPTVQPERSERGCLVAPLVARNAAGVEVARFESGTCWADQLRWVIGAYPPVTEPTTP